ncbi:POC1 centriolar protein A [Ceratobasidium sp. 414]|nr:POC1 centriolar protein A [Ceratobasidium sp. 414]
MIQANRMLLNDLKPVGQAKYDPDRACMPGTREELIKEVLDWCKRPNLPDQPATGRLLWVHGHAGLGKSAIATSVCQALDDEKLLAASFFCKRDDPERRDPQRSLTSLVHSLAVRNSSYGNEVAKALQEDISLCRSPMQTQYDKLVRDVLGSPALAYSSDCLVIVVDALDECGDQSTRRRLLTYLLRMSQLVTWLRVVVTSRPDKDIEETFDQTDAVVFSSLDVHQHNASKDIHTFIHTRLANSKNARLLPEDTGDRLTEHADGLFIWAQTACQFILSSHSPRDRLRAILAADDRSGQSTGALDSLYATAIKASMGDGGEDDARRVRQCLGAIIVCSTRMPLSVVALSALLGERVELDVMQSVVDSLGSVLYTDHSQGDTVRVYHPSFADYMTTPARSGVHCVDLQEQNTVLAVSCMQTMKVELRFNICRLETSYLRNRDVPNLAARVEASVSRQLEYSCLYWTSHLVQAEKGPETTPGGTLSELVTGPEMLYWIEVLSLANKLHTWSAGMQHLKDWCMVSTPTTLSWIVPCCTRALNWLQETALYDYVKDIDRFVQTFYDPITESAPHLYISGLAFLPVNSTLTRLQHKFFPRTITITRGRELTWPNSLRCISHESAVKCVVVSPNGHRIVSGSGCNLQIWDANTGVAIGDALVGHSKPVASVVFSPNGRLIASGSDDGTVRLWDVETGTPLGNPLTGHSGGVRSIAFSPDGHHIASGSGDKTLQVWNVNEGLTVARWPTGHSEALSSVAFSPDSRYIISASWDGTLQMWGANTGMVICNPLALHEDPILSVAFSPDGRHILSGSWDKSLRIWDTATRAAVGSPFIGHSERVYSAAFSPDGHLVVSGSKDKTVRLWNAGTGTTAGNPLIGHSSDVTSVAFFPDGRRVVSGSRDKTVRVWDIDTIDAATTLPDGHTDWVNSVAFSPHSRSIASGSSDMTVRIWDAATGVPIGKPLVGHSGKVTCVAFSPDGRRVASSSRDTTVRIWDADTGATVVGPMVEHSRPVNSLAFSPDGYRVVSGSWDGTLRLWDANTGVATSNPLVEQTYSIWSVSFSPCGRLIISGLDDNTIRVWDASTGTAVGAPLVGHSGSVLSVSFSPNGRRIASGSEDGTVRVWDAGTGAPVGGPFVGHSEQVTSVAFSPDNSYIVSGSWDTSVQVWDASTGTTVGDPLVGHSNLVCSVAFSPDGSRIVSGSTDNIIRVWDVDTVSAVKQLPWDGTTKSLNRAASLSQSPATNLSWLAEHCTPSGWVLSEQKEPLFWAPAEYRRSSRDDSLFIISSDLTQQRPVWLDFSKFVHGTEWATVFAPSEEL